VKIALSGYGKMGRMVERAAIERGHTIVLKADTKAADADKISSAAELARAVSASGADGVIDFTHPSCAAENIFSLAPLGLLIIVGTTGWYDKLEDLRAALTQGGSTLFYSPNFSIGVNLFYRIAEYASRLISSYDEYDTAVLETHHRHKADSPSGTALEIARALMRANPAKKEITLGALHGAPKSEQLHVASLRVGSIPGTHSVFFDSPADTIELKHCARSREGFASGAVRAFEWLFNGLKNGSVQKGRAYTMDDILSSL